MSENESTASGASAADDKTATVQYKPATSLAGNNALAHYEQSRGYNQISHCIIQYSGWNCNLLDVISVYNLNPGKLPGRSCRFSCKRPGYEAIVGLELVSTRSYTMSVQATLTCISATVFKSRYDYQLLLP